MKKLIKLYQPKCAPCQFVENFLHDQGVNYESINVQEHPEIAGKYAIMSTPVTILLDEENNEVQRSAGFNPDALQQLIEQLN